MDQRSTDDRTEAWLSQTADIIPMVLCAFMVCDDARERRILTRRPGRVGGTQGRNEKQPSSVPEGPVPWAGILTARYVDHSYQRLGSAIMICGKKYRIRTQPIWMTIKGSIPL